MKDCMKFLEKLLTENTIIQVTSPKDLPKRHQGYLLLLHIGSKRFRIVKSKNINGFLADHLSNCCGVSKTVAPYIYSQFVPTTQASEWLYYVARKATLLNPFQESDLSWYGYRTFISLSQGKDGAGFAKLHSLYRITAEGSSLVRWSISALPFDERRLINVACKSLNNLTIDAQAILIKNNNVEEFREEKRNFLTSKKYTVEKLDSSRLFNSWKPSLYPRLTSMLNTGEVKYIN